MCRRRRGAGGEERRARAKSRRVSRALVGRVVLVPPPPLLSAVVQAGLGHRGEGHTPLVRCGGHALLVLPLAGSFALPRGDAADEGAGVPPRAQAVAQAEDVGMGVAVGVRVQAEPYPSHVPEPCCTERRRRRARQAGVTGVPRVCVFDDVDADLRGSAR